MLLGFKYFKLKLYNFSYGFTWSEAITKPETKYFRHSTSCWTMERLFKITF